MRSLKPYEMVLVILVLALFVWWAMSHPGFESHQENTPRREALTAIFRDVEPGDSRRNVRAAFANHRVEGMTLYDNQSRDWWCGIPGEWGGGDWILHISFMGDEVLAVRMRTSDGPAPPGAPEDKVAIENPEPAAENIP